MSSCISSSDPVHDGTSTGLQRKAARFVGVFVSLFLLMSVAYWSTRIYFSHTGDLLPMRAAAQELLKRKGDCLYRNVLSSRTHHLFKRALLDAQARMPSVIVLGSSRVLLFHPRMFRSTFLNMGRAGNRLKEALFILGSLASASRVPDVVLIGVDFWWFHPQRSRHPGQTVKPRDISPENFGDVMQMLRKALEQPAYLEAWRRESCNIGVDAILHERGFDRSGFMYMGHLPGPSQRVGFADVLARIHEGRNKFEYGQVADEDMLAAFIATMKALKNRGVLVLAFMPPLPAAVARAMTETGQYEYVDHVRSALMASDVPFFDFSRKPQAFHACQFVDGLHQGDTVNATMLLQMGERLPALRQHLNLPFLHWLAGFTQNALVLNAIRLQRPEEDFLGLGCRKARIEGQP